MSDSKKELPVTGAAEARASAHAAAERLEERAARPDPEVEPVDLHEDEQELIEMELEAIGSVPSPERERAYQALADATAKGRIPTDLVPLLERVVAISLESGRARRRYLAEGEKVLTGLFRRRPAGRELLGNLKEVNRALEVLEDRTVTGVKVSLRTLGHFRVAVQTEDVNVTLSVRSSSVMLESLAVTGGG